MSEFIEETNQLFGELLNLMIGREARVACSATEKLATYLVKNILSTDASLGLEAAQRLKEQFTALEQTARGRLS